MEERLVGLPAEYAEAVRQCFEEYGHDQELYNIKVQEITDHYQAMHKSLTESLGKSLDDADNLY
jgi:hypothetical protein